MTDWDDNMQIECAKSFIKPFKLNVRKQRVDKWKLIDKKNKHKILKITVDIVSNDENAINEDVKARLVIY